MKKITTLIAFFSLIVGMNAQHPVAISAQEWSKKNPNPLKYGVWDFVNFHATGKLKKAPVLHEGITNLSEVLSETRKVSISRTQKHVKGISQFLGREVTLKEFYSGLKVLRISFTESVVLNAYDYEVSTKESWVQHPAGTYEMLCFVSGENVFPVDHVICLNGTNNTTMLAVVNNTATVVGGEVVRTAKPQQEEGDDQDDAAREALENLKSDPNVEPGAEEGNNEGSDKDPHINHDHTTKTVVTPDGKTTMIFNIYGSENRNVAVNKGGTGNASPSEAGVVKTEVFENQLPPVQQSPAQQVQYRQPSCSACGGTNNQHYSNCSTLNRVATNSCNGCGVATTTRTNNGPAIAGAVLSGLNLGYDILTDVFAPNGRFKQQPIPVNRTIYVNNPTPPNPGQGGGQDWGGVTTTGTTGTGSGVDWGGVNQNGFTTTTSTGSTGTWGNATDFVQTGLNGNGNGGGGLMGGGAGFDGGGIIP